MSRPAGAPAAVDRLDGRRATAGAGLLRALDDATVLTAADVRTAARGVESGFKTATASGKFRDSYQQWNTGATNMMEGLKGMETFLTQVVRQHGDLDTTLGSQLGS